MTELFNKNYDFSEDLKAVDEVFLLIEQSIKMGKYSDSVEAAFLRAVYPELLEGGSFRPFMEEAIALRNTSRRPKHSLTPPESVTPPELLNPPGVLLRTLEFRIDKQLRRNFVPEIYPQEANTAYYWSKHGFLASIDQEELLWDMQFDLQSNWLYAYGIYQTIIDALAARWDQGLTLVDIGGSVELPLIKWLAPEAGIHPIKAVEFPKEMPIVPGKMPVDERAQEAVDERLAKRPLIERAVGIDALPINPHDPDARRRIFSDTFPMLDSVKRQTEVGEFNRLIDMQLPLLESIRHPIDAKDPESLLSLGENLPGGRADIFILSFILFEQTPEAAALIIDNLKAYCNPGALFLVTDFAKVNMSEPSKLEFKNRGDWWHNPGAASTYVIDPFQHNQPPIRICRQTTRSGTEISFTQAGRNLIINGKLAS